MSRDLSRAFYTRATYDDPLGGVDDRNAFYDAVGGRIYALEAPASSALPLAVYTVSSVAAAGDFGGASMLTATVDLAIFGKTEAGVDALATIERAAYSVLHDSTITGLTDMDRVYIRSSSRGTPTLEGDYLRLDSTFTLEGRDSSAAT